MGKHKHCYWHWLQCQLPTGKVSLTTLKLTHPDLHRPDQECSCCYKAAWPDSKLPPWKKHRHCCSKTSRVGKGNPSACAQWLTEMARDLLAPIPFREVFVMSALFLPQLTFVDEATTRQELWSSPTVRKFGLVVDVAPTATGLQGMHESTRMHSSPSLHALFQLLTSGNTMQHCPQAASFAVALGTAARQDNGHIVSMASSLALALRSGRSTLAVAGVFGAGKTRSLTFRLAGSYHSP